MVSSQNFRIENRNKSMKKSIFALKKTIANQDSQIESQTNEINTLKNKYPITFSYDVNDKATIYYNKTEEENSPVKFEYYQGIGRGGLEVTTDYMETKPDGNPSMTDASEIELFISGNGFYGPSVSGFETFTISAVDGDNMIVLFSGTLELLGRPDGPPDEMTINKLDEILYSNLTEIDNIQGDFSIAINENSRALTFNLSEDQMNALIAKNIAYFNKK